MIPLRYLRKSVELNQSPLELFSRLTEQGFKSDSLLLESGEPGASGCDKSILITGSALRIRAFGLRLVFEALTANGQAILERFNCQSANLIVKSEKSQEYLCKGASSEFEQKHKLMDDSVFSPIRELISQLEPGDENSAKSAMLAGAFGYELIDAFEQLPLHKLSDESKPDLYLILPETRVLFDHQYDTQKIEQLVVSGEDEEKRYHHAAHELTIIEAEILKKLSDTDLNSKVEQNIISGNNQNEINQIEVDITDEQFVKSVLRCKKCIEQGEVFQIVPSRTFSASCVDPLSAYLRLSQQNPSPYQFYFSTLDFQLFGASPESAVKFNQQTRQVELYPIAGTVKRGRDEEGNIDVDQDNRLECELRLDHKEQAEHMMLVDLARNDIARISVVGTRQVSELLKVDRYSHVMHLVSRVEGKLLPELDALHAYQACLNMGTLTGAPKLRATELIRQFEDEKRGFYGGAIGYLDCEGNLDTAIVIRSALVEKGVAKIRAGAGIVADSEPMSEANETRQKAMAVLVAVTQQAFPSIKNRVTGELHNA